MEMFYCDLSSFILTVSHKTVFTCTVLVLHDSCYSIASWSLSPEWAGMPHDTHSMIDSGLVISVVHHSGSARR